MIDAADAGAGTPPVPDFSITGLHSAPSAAAAGHPAERVVSDEDLQAYGRSSLGVELSQHPDLVWVITEAFNAPLPSGWSEHSDCEARVYFYNEASGESAWEHPTDSVYKEILGLIMQLRLGEEGGIRWKEAIHDHLRQVHQRALSALEGWSGPYGNAADGEYFYNSESNASSWENPLDVWQAELAVRHHVLCRCLLPEDPAGVVLDGGDGGEITFSSGQLDMLTSLRLPLLNLPSRRDSLGNDDLGQPKSPISSRSFHTARSTGTSSARSRIPSARQNAASSHAVSSGSTSTKAEGNDSGEDEKEFTFKYSQGAQMPAYLPPSRPVGG